MTALFILVLKLVVQNSNNQAFFCIIPAKKDCEICDKYEDVLFQIREDLVDSLNAWVVKAVNSQLVRIYSPSKEPALVFFRHGIPLLYDGTNNYKKLKMIPAYS